MSSASSTGLFGRRSQIADAYNFEAFVLELLHFHITLQGKPFELGRQGKPDFDGYAPEGFDNFNGPVVVECMLSFSKLKFRTRIAKMRGLVELKHGEGKSFDKVTVLFIVDQSIELSEVIPGVHRDDPLLAGLDPVIWPWPKFDEIVKLHPEQSQIILDNLLPLRVRNIVRSMDTDWRLERDSRVANLSERYSTGQFTLFLGAGVSSSAGMPDWNSLLNALFITYLGEGTQDNEDSSEDEILELVQRINLLDAPSALVSARYLRKGIARNSDTGRAFTSAIRKVLYGLRDKKVDIASPLIQMLVELCVPRRSGALVRSVLTYNFDDLFERELREKLVVHKCLYSPSEPPDIDELPVYHVHGFVPEDAAQYGGLDDATLVFAEEGYHQIYSDAYHWSNLVQLSALRESTCLMVGLSMADPNLRRLLEIAQRGRAEPRHFAFMKRMTVEKFVSGDIEGKKTQVRPAKASSFLTQHFATTEALMSELGVTVIWYEDYKEIPSTLKVIGFPTQVDP